MTLSEKLRKIVDFFLIAIQRSDEKCTELEGIIAERDETIEALKADFENAHVSLDEALAGLPQTATPDPVSTPGADAIVEAADDAEPENGEAVNDALDNTVGTEEPTTEEAVKEAVEILIESEKMEEAEELQSQPEASEQPAEQPSTEPEAVIPNDSQGLPVDAPVTSENVIKEGNFYNTDPTPVGRDVGEPLPGDSMIA